MRTQWSIVALVASVLLVGCGGREAEDSQNFDANTPAVVIEDDAVRGGEGAVDPFQAAPQVSAESDTRAAATRPAAPRATTGARPRSDVPPATASGAPSEEYRAPVPGSPAATAPASATAPPSARWREVNVPAGTALPLELLTAVSTETAQVEMPVRARLREAVTIGGATVLPAGTILHGHVTDVERPGRVQGRARLGLRFIEAEVAGAREDVRTNPIMFEGEATRGEDATKIGAGAVGGAIIGGILGGGDGAAKGAAIGGAAGTGAVLATRGREISLAAGTHLAASVATPFSIQVQAR